MCKSESIFPYLQINTLSNEFSNLFLDKAYLKMNGNSSRGKISFI